jgi:integrase
VLECLRSALAWARGPAVGKLPAGWALPLTPDVVGSPPAKDPLRQDRLPLADRVRLVGLADRWQLCQLSLSLVLPLRPDEAAGLLVSDVDFERGWLEVGGRAEVNCTKGRQSFKLPFPDELRPLLRACVGGRPEGPLLRSRRAFAGHSGAGVASPADLGRLYQARLLEAPPGKRPGRARPQAALPSAAA